MPGTVRVESKKKGTALLVSLKGDAGMATIGQLQKDLSDICERKPQLTVLDMSELTFISSMGMGTLVSFLRGVEKCGGKVRIAALQPMIAEVFRRARLNKVFELHDTVDAALGGEPKAKKPKK